MQRVGRAGHLVGQRSKGRLIPKTPADLLEQAVLAREMAAGRVEAIRVPINCLDVLAQQLVALAAMDDWNVPELLRAGSPGVSLPRPVAAGVRGDAGDDQRAGIASQPPIGRGRRRAGPAATRQRWKRLQPRVSWDRVHNRLLALPGSQQMALVNGGTIPDTGQYAAYTGNGVRIGELDEEFIYERRVGDAFLLGTNAWRLERSRPTASRVAGRGRRRRWCRSGAARGGGRSYDLGLAIGAFLRELAERLDSPDCLDWLQRECLPRCATPPATCVITSRRQLRRAPAVCRPIARCSSRRRAISSATGR